MIKHFCDWCEAELVGNEWPLNPFDPNGEICRICFLLARSVFNRKHVAKVNVVYADGSSEEFRRVLKIRD